MERFEPDKEQLPPITELLAIADDIDPERAAAKWRDNPPDKDFEAILDADEVDG